MNLRSHAYRGFGCAAAVVLVAGCGSPAADEPEQTLRDTLDVPDSVYVASGTEVQAPDRIYHVLTDYEWYARGEALVHDGRQYMPEGAPLAASLPEMQLVGEYQGVDYYSAERQPGVFFVPVYEGYWQAFHPTSPPAAGS